MTRYRLYAGLGGGYGGAVYHFTDEFETETEAEQAAYEIACEEYYSYDTFQWNDYIEELREQEPNLSEDEYEAMASEAENEDKENWIEYYVVEETDENKNDDD